MKRNYVEAQRPLLLNTYAHVKMKKWIEEKKIYSIWETYLSKSTSTAYPAFYTEVCKNAIKFPTLDAILCLRDIIAPAEWFYTIDQKLPDVPFTKSNSWDYTKSRNFKKLLKIKEKRQIVSWSENHSQNFSTIWNLVNKKRTLIARRIFDMRNALPPEDWFR